VWGELCETSRKLFELILSIVNMNYKVSYMCITIFFITGIINVLKHNSNRIYH